MTRYVLDRTVRRVHGGRVLAGGVPARLVRLTARGSAVLDDALAGRAVSGGAPAGLLRRLDGQGLIHPCGTMRPEIPAPPVTTVIPVRDAPPTLPGLIRALRERGEVIVVDDGSRDDTGHRARDAGATVVPNAGTPGPSAARNTGIRAARTELVALVDADVEAGSDWHAPLVALFDDPDLALAAPIVASVPGHSHVARYEEVHSPLELGARHALVGPGRRVGYVPSAALLARRSALLSIGGFDEELRIGEDVDLVWRLVMAGHKVRYAPEARVRHQPRRSLRALARQRFVYGRSSVVLEARHPGAASPLRAGGATVAIWGAAIAAGPAGALAVLAGSVARTVASHDGARGELARLLVLDHAHSTRHLARVATRDFLPLTLPAALVSRRARRWVALAFLIDLAASRNHRGRARDVPVQAAIRIVDHVAYAAGLWRGVVDARSLAAVRVRVGAYR